jgi:endonuclease-3
MLTFAADCPQPILVVTRPFPVLVFRTRLCLADTMRTSRIARDTNRAMGALNKAPPPPRRVTRALSSQKAMAEPPISVHDEEATVLSSRKRKRDAEPASAKVESPDPETPKTARVRRKSSKPATKSTGSASVEPPSNWERVYELTREMRLRTPAPVDTMGCERLADRTDSPKNQRFQTLVSLMLSSQTKDTVTAAAIRSLQSGLPGGLTLESILSVKPDVLNEYIGKVGFHNTKTKNIKLAAEILRDKFDGDIPSTIDGMMSLPGVGPKMSYLLMSCAWGRHEGIGVDVHVHRITNLWKWHKTKNPEETRAALQSWLPKDKWHEINWLLVGFGQAICLPVGRKCGSCTVGLKGLCPSAVGIKRGRQASPATAEVDIKDVKQEVEDMEDFGSRVKAADA